jgi:iron(III) transport system substrate-binding protein
MRLSSSLATTLCLVATTPFLAACGGDDESSSASAGSTASTATAKELTVYSGRDEELVGPLFDRFERETGVKLNVRYGDTAEMASTLLEEGDRSPADVFVGQDAGATGALEKAGRLAELPDATLEKVDERFRSDDDAWVGLSGRARVLAYDKRKVKEADLPASIYDLTGPAWKGKVGWVPTNASFQAALTAMREVGGEDKARDWLTDMQANDPTVFEKNGAARDAVASGEVETALINHYYVTEAIKELGAGKAEDYPVGLHFFPGGDVGALGNVASAGVVRSSDAGGTAQRLIDFLLTKESQTYFSEETTEYPLAAGVAADPILPPLESIQQPDVDLSDIDDLDGTLQLEESTGVL